MGYKKPTSSVLPGSLGVIGVVMPFAFAGVAYCRGLVPWLGVLVPLWGVGVACGSHLFYFTSQVSPLSMYSRSDLKFFLPFTSSTWRVNSSV